MDIEKLKRKRGRKSKKELEFIKKYEQENNISIKKKDDKKPKKRGRKPKGGKIIEPDIHGNVTETVSIPNVILHLKCCVQDLENTNMFLSDMKYKPEIENIQPYNTNMNETIESKGLQYYNIEVNNDYDNNDYELKQNEEYHNYDNKSNYENNTKYSNNKEDVSNKTSSESVNTDKKIIWEKLKNIQQMLRSDTMNNKNSSCFRCTCEFDNPSISIPMYDLNGTYKSYGNFCMPECAAGFLFDESIESSIKWERYSLLNNIYKPVYNYTTNIKPSGSPFYLLDKFYGTLTIDEYREMSRKNHYGVLMMVDKPLIRVMPELFNDTTEYTEVMNKPKYKLSRKKPPINKSVVNNKTWLF